MRISRFLPTLSALCLLTLGMAHLAGQTREPDWAAMQPETLRHYQALVKIDTTGHEAAAVDYLKSVLEKEGIPVKIFAKDAKRPNLVARIKGNGSKKPILIMAHTDTVGVQPEKWTYPPFSATRKDGFVYGRGTIDDKDNVTAGLMAMLTLKRLGTVLDRDVIFLAEAGEEGMPAYGIQYMVDEHWPEIEAEYCIAEGGNGVRSGGKLSRILVGTTEKIPNGMKLVAHGPSGHGSRPLPDNAVARLANAVARISAWQPPMRLNDTTRTYFERLATVSSPEAAARYNGLVNPAKSAEIQEYLRVNETMHYSMLRTSISPTMLKAGFRSNVIPSEAEATLDVRAVPDENMPAFIEMMKKVIGDPNVEIVTAARHRPAAPASRLDTELFHAIEAAGRGVYEGVAVIPTMATGASDKAQLQSKGVQCYGIGPALDEEDGPKGYGAHSDQERLLESELYRFTVFNWEIIRAIAAHR